jgi:hypothetical protein
MSRSSGATAEADELVQAPGGLPIWVASCRYEASVRPARWSVAETAAAPLPSLRAS